ncbi:MAG: chemotaxis protein CheB [Bdellovibrionaceae bacterium]|nr:chemotaxis protein CheB [Pseudobdellovibrionaceae bacterium]MBX3032864.1 chemotaxis protein CheB [Pseudobdellovibrionaceae bacterium]
MIPRLCVIGTSAGGVKALQTVLAGLPASFPVPIVVVHHLPPTAKIDVQAVFGRLSLLPVIEAEDKMPLEDGCVYIAPPAYHLLVERTASLALSMDELVNFSRPSIDLLFESAADSYRDGVVGILMTGANQDGAAGMEYIRKAGGHTIVQDPDTAEARLMPESALRRMTPNAVLPLEKIPLHLIQLVKESADG